MKAVELLRALTPIIQRLKPPESPLPTGAICLRCKELGPCLVVSDGVPDEVTIGLQFVCGGCGREWEWSYNGAVYTFVREVQQEI